MAACRHDNITAGPIVRDADGRPIARTCPDCGRDA